MLAVIAFHTGLPVPGGFVGVDIFFVISGFVITSMLLREWQATGQISFSQFYWRRFKRLIPALAILVSFVALVSVVVLSPFGAQQNAAKTGIGAMLMVANAVIQQVNTSYFATSAETNPLLNTWSLSVEEQFYLAFPLLLLLGLWIGCRGTRLRQAATVCVLSATLASFSLMLLTRNWYVPFLPEWAFGFFSPLSRAWEFGLGALLALVLPQMKRLSRGSSLPMGWVGIGCIFASLWMITDQTNFPGLWTLLPVTGTALVIAAGWNVDGSGVTRILSSRPLVVIGDSSYSLYLWHWPLIVFAVVLWPQVAWVPIVAVMLSLIPSWMSYRFVESPLRRRRRFSHRQATSLVCVTLVIPILLCWSMLITVERGFWIPELQGQVAAVTSMHAATRSDCDEGSMISRPEGDCVWNESASGTPIYLVGDSNADHFSEAVIAAGQSMGSPVTVTTSKWCPFLATSDPLPGRSSRDSERCRAYVEGTLEWLSSQRPGYVVLALADRYLDEEPVLVAASAAGEPHARYERFANALRAAVDQVRADGHEVLLVQSAPTFATPYAWEPIRCSAGQVLGGSCNQVMPVSFVNERQTPTREIVNWVAAESGASVLDPRSAFCTESECSAYRDGVPLYMLDGWHVSVAASESLTDEFLRALLKYRSESD